MKSINKQLFHRGLLVGFTTWQTTVAYPLFKKFFNEYNIELDFQKIDEYTLCVQNNAINLDFNQYDFCIQLVKDQYISSIFEQLDKPCFNKYNSMVKSDDKFLTYIKLYSHNIPMPKTVSGNTDFDGLVINNYNRSALFVDNIENKLNYPFVAKPTFGYGGRGVRIIHDRNELEKLLQEQGQTAYIFQEFVSDNVGNNIRVVVVGGKVIYSVLRKDTINTNYSCISSETEEKFYATKEQIKIAQDIAQILSLDYCAIDFFDTIDKRPLVCEVNANPGGILDYEKITGVNQAKELVKFIIKKVYNETKTQLK